MRKIKGRIRNGNKNENKNQNNDDNRRNNKNKERGKISMRYKSNDTDCNDTKDDSKNNK